MIDLISEKDNNKLHQIISQQKYYLEARFELIVLNNLIQSKNRTSMARSESFESIFSFVGFDDISNRS